MRDRLKMELWSKIEAALIHEVNPHNDTEYFKMVNEILLEILVENNCMFLRSKKKWNEKNWHKLLEENKIVLDGYWNSQAIRVFEVEKNVESTWTHIKRFFGKES